LTDAITVHELTKRYGDFAAVDGISFAIPAGRLVAVLGPNGAGKTTTIEKPAPDHGHRDEDTEDPRTRRLQPQQYDARGEQDRDRHPPS
jgi:ABC-type uncharacterized transport system ATPase subunit